MSSDSKKLAASFGFSTQGYPSPPTGVISAQDAYYKAENKPAVTEVDSSWQPAPPLTNEEDTQDELEKLYAERDRLLKELDKVNAEIYRRLGQQ